MKNLAQICIAMAEAGIRLQTGEDLAAAGSGCHAAAAESRRPAQPEHLVAAPAARGPEPASIID